MTIKQTFLQKKLVLLHNFFDNRVQYPVFRTLILPLLALVMGLAGCQKETTGESVEKSPLENRKEKINNKASSIHSDSPEETVEGEVFIIQKDTLKN